ncbi:MAG: homoserine dehydrogenase [Candidatus Bathyarchaeia archaeon]
MREVKLVFVGFGGVAQGCAKHLASHKEELERDYGFQFKVVAISDTVKGSILNSDQGINLSDALKVSQSGKKLDAGALRGKNGLSTIETIRDSDAEIVIEATWTNLKDAEPGLTHLVTALENGKDVATSNKGPIALAYKRLTELAKLKGRQLRFESTVMSGTPVFNMREFALQGATITALKGILNGTSNYVLTEMAAGKNYNEVLKRAQELGYAEVDPSGDVEAYDPTAKITILANALMNADVNYRDVERQGITQITLDDINKAAKESKRIKLIASASKDRKGKWAVSCKPTLLPTADILAHVDGVMNALKISMDVQPDVTIIGPGAGGDSAGYGLLSDVLTIHRLRNLNAR